MGAEATAPGPLARLADEGVVLGVCAGIARSLGRDVALVRIAALALVAFGGMGVVLYAIAAAALPVRGQPSPRSRRRGGAPMFAAALVVGAILALLGGAGLLLPRWVFGPFLLAAVGIGLIWRRAGREVHVGAAGDTIWAGVRSVFGIALVTAGLLLAVRQAGGVGPALAVGLTAGAVAAGIGLLVAPRLRRARTDADAERRERIAGEERARVADRLHDSVLQTLALIQREPDAERARALARRQDRELRAWLYDGHEIDIAATLAGALRAAVADVEDDYGVTITLVQPADLPMDERLEALVDAAREAMTNAAKHSGTAAVDVMVRAASGEVSVFVRDRGAGFDTQAVPDDRRGLRDSIRGRLARVGGRVSIESAAGAGTDIELAVPRESRQ